MNTAYKNEKESIEDEARQLKGIVAAIDRVMAVIEFNLDGTIVRANERSLI